jgi:hypothetical protein
LHWKLKSGQWEYTGVGNDPGVFYVYQKSVSIQGNPGSSSSPWRATIITEASVSGPETNHCPHGTADIDMGGGGYMVPADGAAPMLLVSGRDISIHGTQNANYNGAFAAHEQISLSGNPHIVGAVISNDYCDSADSLVHANGIDASGNVSVHYDGGLDVPIGKTLTVTRWFEL